MADLIGPDHWLVWMSSRGNVPPAPRISVGESRRLDESGTLSDCNAHTIAHVTRLIGPPANRNDQNLCGADAATLEAVGSFVYLVGWYRSSTIA